MARARRNRSYRLSKVHDRRSRDLPRNAEVAEVEIDDPLALEPGEKIVALRSIRNDPLGRLHSHRQIDEAQYQAGRAFQNDWERAERGPQALDPTREHVDGVRAREPVTEAQRMAVLRLNRAERELRRRRRGAGARRSDQGHDHGSGRASARTIEPTLERLFLATISRMSRPAGAPLWVCDQAEIAVERGLTASRAPHAGQLEPFPFRLNRNGGSSLLF